jgi:nucleotide-binding universal stress UspA family protein
VEREKGGEHMAIEKILVPIDFTPASDAALRYALAVADETGAEVEVLYVWQPSTIFAVSPEGVAMEERLSAAEVEHRDCRVCGRLEFGEAPDLVILAILERERFDLVVMGADESRRHVAENVASHSPCKVVLKAA